MDVSALRQAHEDFLAVAEAGGFGPPPPGEWDAERLLAHMAATDAAIASVTLAVIAGQRPVYDNRASLDESNLRRLVADAGGLAGLTEQVREHGRLLRAAASALPSSVADTQISIYIVSGTTLVVDEPWPLSRLITSIGTFHLPQHATQLAALRP